jgi:uncharacterized phage protein (TIGR01671 family)
MRDFKFKIWDKINLKMFSVNGFFIEKNKVIFFNNNEKIILNSDEVDILQYTGIKDKNNTEIFEGDIIEFKRSHDIKRFIVSWKENQASFGFDYHIIDSWSLSWNEETIPSKEEWAVIGNKYENPELLKY